MGNENMVYLRPDRPATELDKKINVRVCPAGGLKDQTTKDK
ncbi:MAG: hypothetical protein ACJAY5_000306 [Actinomycetes bacterium]|jgi:hypothetical protein